MDYWSEDFPECDLKKPDDCRIVFREKKVYLDYKQQNTYELTDTTINGWMDSLVTKSYGYNGWYSDSYAVDLGSGEPPIFLCDIWDAIAKLTQAIKDFTVALDKYADYIET